ncbi:MAG: DUF1013 domain-containing protein [Parvibaculales bacterium]
MTYPLMPKATAVWLIDNTALTFDQIADFCGLHALEVKGIADGDVAHGIKGLDPINSGQLSRDEIERCQNDPTAKLTLQESKSSLAEPKKQKGARYMPLSKRQERPNAIYWLVRNHPELNDAQIGRLIGTTKPTIQSIRERTHWNLSNLKPVDPVTLGLCKQVDLDHEVSRAAKRIERAAKKQAKLDGGASLLSAEESVQPASVDTEPEVNADNFSFNESEANETQASEADTQTPDIDSVFSKFND